MTRDTEDVVEQLQRLLAGFAGENELSVGPHMLAHGVEEALAAIQSLSDRIDRLEGAIGKARIQISGGLCYFSAEAKHAQLADADRTLADALGEKSLTDAVIARAALHQEGISATE